jgi:diguanylate cyclase (GGDEF)-like protein
VPSVARPRGDSPPNLHGSGLPEEAEIYSVVQPIVRLDDRVVVGYEALARVDSVPAHGPDWWLTHSELSGLRTELEIMFLESAARLGSPPLDALLFVNASPNTLAEPALFALRERLPERLVIEITEQAAVDDYTLLNEQLEPWMQSRVRFAIDDTGAGYSSLRHVIELSPDFLKLDRTLIHGIDKDSHRNALVRALAAFAREVGTSVIAEGIETPAELAALLAAEVPLGQGYLLARPGPAWPRVDELWRPARPLSDPSRDTGLEAALARAVDASAACEAVVAHLFRLSQVMPSLYLENNGRLRCVAQRGLWQVLDGLPPGAGITGRVWATGEPIQVDDVTSSHEYLEAAPGVVAEICVPVTVDEVVIGALNLDSLSPLPRGTLDHLQDCAEFLSRRLGTLGWQPRDSPWQRGVHGSIAISAAAADRDAATTILTTMLAASGMDSAGLVRISAEGLAMHATIGPLAPTLHTMDGQSLASVCTLVDHLSSCYTGSETTGLPYLGSEILRAGGARAVVLLPLRSNNVGLGAVILAHSKPMRLSADLVEPLELLAGQAAATLNAVDLMEQLRHQAHHDALTGLGNRLALDRTLDRLAASAQTVMIADLDHFKQVNDRYGHVGGDEALRTLARQLTTELPSLSLYRMGGDEFLCLLPKADVAQARQVAETVRAIAHRVLERWGTSVSIGLAVPSSGESPHQTLARADQALLWAKQHTRGGVAVSPDEQLEARARGRQPNRERHGGGIARDRVPDRPGQL